MNEEQKIVTAKIAADEVVDLATKTASNLIDKSDERITKQLTAALRDIFGEHKASGRFIDVSRIPLICKSIIDTSARLQGIEKRLDDHYVSKEEFGPVKQIVYGLISLILVAVVGALLALVIRK